MADRKSKPQGRVYLVGAGPGDPGLITLRGVECLHRAEAVLYDYLVNPVIAQHAPAEAELTCLGRHGGHSRIWTQDEINQRLLELAQAGKTVVRLKGGDPAVFARGGDEAAFLLKHGISLEIVPGITAALAAGSHAGIPITHRKLASAVALVTGREDADKAESGLDYQALANFPGTLIFYMGVSTASHWTSELIRHGLSGETPVAIVRRCSLPEQQVVRCRLAEVADKLTPYSKFPPPVIVIVGEVAGQQVALDWFEQRPLFGKRVMVTRPSHQSHDLGRPLHELGAHVLYQPAIRLEGIDDEATQRAVRQIAGYDWIVFSSANGVRFFFDRLFGEGLDLRCLGGVQLATIGSATTAALAKYHLHSDLQPDEFQAEALAERLASQAAGKRLLLVRASRGREVLADRLAAAGAAVDQVVFYRSVNVEQAEPDLRDMLRENRVDWLTVTSSAIAQSLVRMFGNDLRKSRLASISPITSATLRELGFPPDVEAATATMEGIVDSILTGQRQVH